MSKIEQFFEQYYPGTKVSIVEAITPEELKRKLENGPPPSPPPPPDDPGCDTW